MRKLELYWRSNPEWWHRQDNLVPVINDDAPPEAQESYKRYLEQERKATEDIAAGRSMD